MNPIRQWSLNGQATQAPAASRVHAVKRVIAKCGLNTCPHCGSVLRARKPWHSRKHVQTLDMREP